LEYTLQKYEDERAKILLSSAKPDEKNPVRLENALQSIVERTKSASLEQLEEFKTKIKSLEREVLAKDRKITQMELALGNPHPRKDGDDNDQIQNAGLKMAAETIRALQSQIRSKEEMLIKYQDKLQETRQESIHQREART
jgi:hypothetical protein